MKPIMVIVFGPLMVFVYSIHYYLFSLQWRHNEHDSVSNHQPHDCLLKRLFRHWSKKTSKFRVTGLCEGNSPVNIEFPAQRASNAENVSIWWRHHVCVDFQNFTRKSVNFAARWNIMNCLELKSVQLVAWSSSQGLKWSR